MKTVADFVLRVLANIPRDTREELVQLAVRDSLNEFMRKSRAFLEEFHVPLSACGNVIEFVVEMPDCRKLVEMTALWAAPSNCVVGRRNASWDKIPKARSEFECGWWVMEHGTANIALRVNEWYARTSMMAVEYAFTLARDGCEVPDQVYEEWFDAILAGARSRIFNDPDSAAYNPRIAEIERSKFEAAIADARIRSRLNYGGGYEISPQSMYCGVLGG